MKISALGESGPASRTQLTRQRVVAAAVELADGDGTESISMRRLAQELGVEAMSLYTHVRNKDDLLDGMADAVISEIPLSAGGAGWKTTLRQMALAAREAMVRHPWAPRVVETRTAPGPAALGYIDAVIGTLREGGFTIAQAHAAIHILGSRALGFAQALFDDSGDGDLSPEAAAQLQSQLGATHPYVVEMALAVTHGGALGSCDGAAEFAFALDFILDGLERLQGS